jgi:hypothetical protein
MFMLICSSKEATQGRLIVNGLFICFNDALSAVELIWFVMTWEGGMYANENGCGETAVMKCFKVLSRIFLEGLRKTTKNFSQDNK